MRTKASVRRYEMPRAPRRLRAGARAIREIRKYQRTTSLLMRRLPFARLVREITEDFARERMRWTAAALAALQEAAESYVVHLLEDTNLLTLHRGRQTIDVRDLQMARRLRGPNDVGC